MSAFDAACHDDMQYVMKRVISYAGNCARRTEMRFRCENKDGTIAEITWTSDILCEAFYDICKMKPYFYHLTLDTKDAAQTIAGRNREDIRTGKPGEVDYVDIRFFVGRW